MKQLTCEMCGSTDLLKQDGVFVCQTCGTKYSVDEAKKMMVEGTVEVTGTVKVDESDNKKEKVDNYLTMAKTALEGNDAHAVVTYSDKILEIDPNNFEAWFLKSKVLFTNASLEDIKIPQIIAATKRAIDLAPNYTVKYDIATDIYTRVKNLVEFLFDTANKLPALGQPNSMEYIQLVLNHWISFLVEVPFIHTSILNAELEDLNVRYEKSKKASLPSSKKFYFACCVQIFPATKSLFEICQDKLYAKIQLEKDERELKFEAERAAEQKERQAKYWENHAEEKERLESELNQLNEQISGLETELDNANSTSKIENLRTEIQEWALERNSLGMFKSKEKKALQEKIDANYIEINSLKDSMNNSKEKIEPKIKQLKERVQEILDEFNAER